MNCLVILTRWFESNDLGWFDREIDVIVPIAPLAEQEQTELVAADDRVLVKRMVLRVQNLRIKIDQMVWEIMISRLFALIQLGSLYLQGIRDTFDILHVIVLYLRIWGIDVRTQIKVGRLAIEIVLLNHMHRIIVPTCQNIQLVQIFAVLPSLERRYL